MKLEYIYDGSTEISLVPLFDFDSEQASRLRDLFGELAANAIPSVGLHDAYFVETVGNCRLTLTVAPRDQGVVKTGEPASFQCSLTSETWDNIEGLVEPFARPAHHGFQWLNHSAIPLLLSTDGHW